MRMLHAARHLWRDLIHRGRVERELDDELRAYVDLAIAERVRHGVDPARARREVLLSMRGTDDVKERVRDTRRTIAVETLVQDVRFAVRSFRRNPAFTVVAVSTLAVGIGGATGVFSIVNATLLRPLAGVAAPNRLVSFERTLNGATYDNFSLPDFLDYEQRARAFSGLTASIGTPASLSSADGRTERLRADLVSGGYFGVLGAAPAAGRLLVPGDDRPGAPRVVVISYRLWQRLFGGRLAALGTSLRLDEQPFTVVGVASRPFTGSRVGGQTDLWAPLAAQPVLLSRMSADIMTTRTAGWLAVAGRLAPSATFAEATAEVQAIAGQLAAQYPATNAGRGAVLHHGLGLDPDDRGALTRMLTVVSAAVALLLFIACANVAGLLVVRSAARRHEMAARLALGASRARLVRQLVVEGALLAGAAGAGALTFAIGLARLATRLEPADSVLHGVPIALDGRVLGVAAATALLSAVALTIAPAFRVSHLEPNAVIRASAPGAGGSRPWAQRAVVSAQVALSFALLMAAVLLTVAVQRLLAAPPGFDPDAVVVASIDLAAQGYPPARGLDLYRRLITRLADAPAFRSTAFAKTVPPLDWSDRVSLFRPGAEPPQHELRDRQLEIGFRVQMDRVTPGYFRTLGIPMRRGRDFTTGDGPGAPGVAIVNESLARTLWPGLDPVGQRLSWPSLTGPPRAPLVVVGVVADHRYTSLTTAAAPLLYVPELQAYDGRATIVARAAGDPGDARRALLRALHDVDPTVPVYGATSMRQRMAASVGQQRTLGFWVAAFALLALGMSAVGMYAVVSQSVAQRTRELSLRMALGATPRRLMAFVVREAGLIAAAGLVAGVPLALAFGSLLRDPLQGMEWRTAEAWIGSAGLLAATVLVASYLPARRAATMNPADALRCD